MKRKLISLLLTVTMVLQALVFTTAAGAANVQEDAAYTLYALGLFKGTDKGFELDRQPTRTEGLVMFVRLLGAEEKALNENNPHPFRDVPAWADDYVGYAYCNGLTKGVSQDTFGAAQFMTVGQYMTLILRALGYDDSMNDFAWNTSMDKAREIGLLKAEKASSLLNQSATRGTMTELSVAALSQPFKDDRLTTLAHSLVDQGVFTQAQAVQCGVWKEPAKPYSADILVRAAMIPDSESMMVLDNNDNLIYYDELKGEIIRIAINKNKVTKTETLLNVKNLTCNTVVDGINVTYKDMEVYQVFWDDIKNRLMITGAFNAVDNSSEDGWENSSLQTSYEGIFALESGSFRFLGKFPQFTSYYSNGYICKYILGAMSNGNYIMGPDVSVHEDGAFVMWDAESGDSIPISTYIGKIFEYKGEVVYLVNDYHLALYNYASNDFEDVAQIGSLNGAYLQNDVCYIWRYDTVLGMKTTGQTKTLLELDKDVNVLDMTNLPHPGGDFDFVVTTDGSFIFYDQAAKSIRTIYRSADTPEPANTKPAGQSLTKPDNVASAPANTQPQSQSQPQPQAETRKIYYKDICLNDSIGLDYREVAKPLGNPTGGTPVDGYLLFGGTEYVTYRDNFTFLLADSAIALISGDASAMKIGDATLDKDRAGIIRLLGEPIDEGQETHDDEAGEGFVGSYYMMTYYYDEIAIIVEMPDINSTARSVTITKLDQYL